ncbi:MAG: urease accessory protein UreD [Actinomycetota bacterium]|nr:urease accessory protein UreD [Actinomycetota bacterium]
MHARAELTAAAPVTAGRSCRLVRRLDGAPLAWRSTPDAVYLVGTAATPVGDDSVDIDVAVEAGATLRIRSTAATVAWSATGTTQRVTASVADGGMLDWQLQPLVATAECHHLQAVNVRLEGSGRLRWTEQVLLGRSHEAPGHLDLRLDVDLDDEALVRHQLCVGPDVAGWAGPAVLGGQRAFGFALHAGRHEPRVEPAAGEGWAVLNLDGPAAMTVAVAADLSGLRRALDEAGGTA